MRLGSAEYIQNLVPLSLFPTPNILKFPDSPESQLTFCRPEYKWDKCVGRVDDRKPATQNQAWSPNFQDAIDLLTSYCPPWHMGMDGMSLQIFISFICPFHELREWPLHLWILAHGCLAVFLKLPSLTSLANPVCMKEKQH